jgi:prolyl-tRNA synthetase
VLPPRIAPTQVVIVPIWRNDTERTKVQEAVAKVRAQLSHAIRIYVDDREAYSPGWKFNEWEMRGVPLRIEIGPRDVERDQVMLARRDMPGREGKSPVSMDGLCEVVEDALQAIQGDLLRRAEEFRRDHTYDPESYEAFMEVLDSGFADSWWCGDASCEAQIKDDTKATIRCIPLDQEGGQGRCIRCGRPAHERAIFARAY